VDPGDPMAGSLSLPLVPRQRTLAS
jgi:hypothetical protein